MAPEQNDVMPGPGSRAFPQSGFYIMRHEACYMIVDCLSAKRNVPAAHKHNGRLGFELFAFDKTFLVDPGTYVYSSDEKMRQMFRSTAYHNTVVVDGKEQNEIFFPFVLIDTARVNVHEWIVQENYDMIVADHSAYSGITHLREIYFNKREHFWVIGDHMTGTGEHRFDVYFRFAPGIEVMEDFEREFMFRTDVEGANLAVLPLETTGLQRFLEEGWVSRSYGKKDRAPVLKYTKEDSAPVSFITLLYPYRNRIRNSIDIKKDLESAASDYFEKSILKNKMKRS